MQKHLCIFSGREKVWFWLGYESLKWRKCGVTRSTRSIITPTLLARVTRTRGSHHGFESLRHQAARIWNLGHNISPGSSIVKLENSKVSEVVHAMKFSLNVSPCVGYYLSLAHVWEGLIDTVERDQLSRPERCQSDDTEPLIGQKLNIKHLIGSEWHIQTENDSIKNLYNLVEGTVGTLSCGDIMEIKHWWMEHCLYWRRPGECQQTLTESWSLLSSVTLQTPESRVSSDHMTQCDICREKPAHCTALLDNRVKISWYALKYDNFQK